MLGKEAAVPVQYIKCITPYETTTLVMQTRFYAVITTEGLKTKGMISKYSRILSTKNALHAYGRTQNLERLELGAGARGHPLLQILYGTPHYYTCIGNFAEP